MRFSRRVAMLALLLLGTTAGGKAVAQDSHYWTNQYGTQAELLGGAVVGAVKDLSGTFYNPGALALTNDPKLVLTTSAFQVQSITIDNAGGAGINLDSVQGAGAPSIFAARFTVNWLGTHSLAISYLTRYKFDFSSSAYRIDGRDVLPPPGNEFFAGELAIRTRLGEDWGGLTWSKRIRDRVGFGISQFVAYRSQSSRKQTIAQAVAPDSTGAALILVDDFSYWHVRTLTKLGLLFDLAPVSFGFGLTTPSIGLFGSGSTFLNASGINLNLEENPVATSELASDYQSGLNPTYRSPLSISGGASYAYRSTSFHVTAEWFDQVDSFVALPAQTFEGQTIDFTFDPSVSHRLESVVNYGIGVEHVRRSGVILSGSFTTDFSASAGDDSELSTSNWDIYHIGLGSAFQARGVGFTVGMVFSFGKREEEALGSLGDFQEDLVGAQLRYRRIKALLGFDIPI